MLTPNIGRILVRKLNYSEKMTSGGLLIAGQMVAGENLLVGEVVAICEEPGQDGYSTKFKVGKVVYYSEYSAAAVVDCKPLITGEVTLAKMNNDKLFIVAEDDVMAYESEDIEVPDTARQASATPSDISSFNKDLPKSPIFPA